MFYCTQPSKTSNPFDLCRDIPEGLQTPLSFVFSTISGRGDLQGMIRVVSDWRQSHTIPIGLHNLILRESLSSAISTRLLRSDGDEVCFDLQGRDNGPWL